MDEKDGKTNNRYVEDHSQYPFLHEEEGRRKGQDKYNPYEEPQYNNYENYHPNQI